MVAIDLRGIADMICKAHQKRQGDTLSNNTALDFPFLAAYPPNGWLHPLVGGVGSTWFDGVTSPVDKISEAGESPPVGVEAVLGAP